jgi:Zn-dependent protease with chaperone function/tetratricopeptide (TPR) repeat protein
MVGVRPTLRTPVALLALLSLLGAGLWAQAPPRRDGDADARRSEPDRNAPVRKGDDLFDKSLQAALEALKVYGRWDSPADLRRVTQIGYRVAQESEYRDYPITFGLIDMAEPNAFALPGGEVFVTRGMLAMGLNDDELAALLGHEIAHVVHRHSVRMERRATLLNVLTQALMVGVMVGADHSYTPPPVPDPYGVSKRAPGSGDLVFGSYAASLILGELLMRSYSREFEDEADQDGQRWAAAAGFAPDGADQLMELLGSRLPESKDYGYWRTHPFFTERVAAAKARGHDLARGTEKPTAEFRSWTQGKVLDLGSNQPPTSDAGKLIERFALSAWPRGAEADRLRLERIHRVRDAALDHNPESRDYGKLLGAYDREITEVSELEPTSSLLGTLRGERETLASECRDLYPKARAIWNGGIYQTNFLEAFLSNWPDAPEVPDVALALGEAYGRTQRQSDAVAMFLKAVEAGPGTPAGEKALRGLRNVAPSLNELTALAELTGLQKDPELARVAGERLAALAGTYSDLATGAAYLQKYPDGKYTDQVTARLNVLAENLYGEVVLYQSIGDHVRAIDRIQKILTHAPASPAAHKLLEHSVLPS